jgi:hypothetical protein
MAAIGGTVRRIADGPSADAINENPDSWSGLCHWLMLGCLVNAPFPRTACAE